MKEIMTRQAALRKLIQEYPIEDQTTLVQLLKEKYGIDTNQSIVSRDLRTMRATKHMVNDTLIYALEEKDASREILNLAVRDIVHNKSTIVIKTLPGLADFVGDYLDMHEENSGLLGTLAGENVVFAVPANEAHIKNVYQKLCTLLYFKKKVT